MKSIQTITQANSSIALAAGDTKKPSLKPSEIGTAMLDSNYTAKFRYKDYNANSLEIANENTEQAASGSSNTASKSIVIIRDFVYEILIVKPKAANKTEL